MKRLNLIGERFGKLKVLEMDGIKNGATTWLCKCDCGNTVVVSVGRLRSEKTQSCGCIWRGAIIEANTTHNQSKTRLYRTWNNMLNRCRNANTDSYSRYGGRGIRVCEDWHSFELFRDWAVNNGYADNLSIDRKNVDGDYEPDNCRWIPMSEQAGNTRKNRRFTINGVTKTAAEWARDSGVNYKRLMDRIYRGWDIERALATH